MKHALIVDPHPIVREATQHLLQEAFPTMLIKTSSGAQGVLEEVCASPWAVVVLDVNLRGHNGFDLLKDVHAKCPDIPIVVFSSFSESRYAARAVRAGARAYLSKERSPADLIHAVTLALQRGPIRTAPQFAGPTLSPREIQILRCLGKGLSVKEVAHALHISPKTVTTYRMRLFSKLDLRTQGDLIRYATEERFVQF